MNSMHCLIAFLMWTLSIYLSVHLSVCLSVCLSIYLSIICRISTYSKANLEAFCLAVVGRKGPNGELAVLGLASADDKSGDALYVSLSFASLDVSCVDHLQRS